MSLLPTCVVCDALLRGYNGDCLCDRCKQPCPTCGGDVAYCHHKLAVPIGRKPRPLEERFWPKVKRLGPNECWEWQAGVTDKGYGRISVGPQSSGTMMAHRASWEIANGPIPAGLLVLHRCDNPPCVNPAHLFLGTLTDNVRDMVAKGRCWQQKKTHCPHGHEYTPENTVKRSRWRRCLTCYSSPEWLAYRAAYSRAKRKEAKIEADARKLVAERALGKPYSELKRTGTGGYWS